MNCKCFLLATIFAGIAFCSSSYAQSPGVLYTWDGTGDIREWKRNFGDPNVALANTTAGELTITENSGGLETS